jgi:hypothetical protein
LADKPAYKHRVKGNLRSLPLPIIDVPKLPNSVKPARPDNPSGGHISPS